MAECLNEEIEKDINEKTKRTPDELEKAVAQEVKYWRTRFEA